MTKIINCIKNNLKLIEKVSLLVSSILILAISLIFNIFADTILNVSVGYLIYGLVTGIAGGAFLLLGLNTNLFDVKIKGLIFVGIGVILSIASVLLYPGYISSNAFSSLSEIVKEYKNAEGVIYSTLTKDNIKVYFNLFMIFSIISSVVSCIGLGSQLFRKIKNIDD